MSEKDSGSHSSSAFADGGLDIAMRWVYKFRSQAAVVVREVEVFQTFSAQLASPRLHRSIPPNATPIVLDPVLIWPALGYRTALLWTYMARISFVVEVFVDILFMNPGSYKLPKYAAN